MSKQLVDLKLLLVVETEKAYGIKEVEDQEGITWIPKSQCEATDRDDKYITLTMPEWLAQERELI